MRSSTPTTASSISGTWRSGAAGSRRSAATWRPCIGTSAAGRLLDVGCHLGMFLDVAREHGWDVTGVEPSRWSVERARERGLDVRHGTLDTVHFDG